MDVAKYDTFLPFVKFQAHQDLEPWVEQYCADTFLADVPGKSLPPQPSLWFSLWAARTGNGADLVPGTLFEDEKSLRAAFDHWWASKKHVYEAAGLLQADGKLTYPHRKKKADGEWQVYEYKHQPFVKDILQLMLINEEATRRRQYRALLRWPVDFVCNYFRVPEGAGKDAADHLMRLLCKRKLVGPFLHLRVAASGLQSWPQHRAFKVSRLDRGLGGGWIALREGRSLWV